MCARRADDRAALAQREGGPGEQGRLHVVLARLYHRLHHLQRHGRAGRAPHLSLPGGLFASVLTTAPLSTVPRLPGCRHQAQPQRRRLLRRRLPERPLEEQEADDHGPGAHDDERARAPTISRRAAVDAVAPVARAGQHNAAGPVWSGRRGAHEHVVPRGRLRPRDGLPARLQRQFPARDPEGAAQNVRAAAPVASSFRV